MKLALGWFIGITGYEFFKGLWHNEAMDWQSIIDFSIAGFIGMLIVYGLRNFFKKDKG